MVARVLGIFFFFVSCTLDLEQEKQASWKCPWEQSTTKIVQKSALSSSRRSQENRNPHPHSHQQRPPHPGRRSAPAHCAGVREGPLTRQQGAPPAHHTGCQQRPCGVGILKSPPHLDVEGGGAGNPNFNVCLHLAVMKTSGGDGAPPSSFLSRVRRKMGRIPWQRACSAAHRGLNQVQSHNVIQKSPGFSSNSLVRPSIGRISSGMKKTIASGQRCWNCLTEILKHP